MAAKKEQKKKTKSAAATRFSSIKRKRDAAERRRLTGPFEKALRSWKEFFFRTTSYCCGDRVISNEDEETVCCGTGQKGRGKNINLEIDSSNV